MTNKKKKINIKIVAIISIVLIVIVVTLFNMLIRKEDKLTLNETELYQYSGDNKINYIGNVEIDKKNEITTISFDNMEESVTLDSTPVFYVNEKKVVFPKNMSLIFPREATQFKINYFTYLTMNDHNEVTLKDRTTKKMIEDCIIYDGKDLYFLIGNYKTTIDGKEYELPSFSYLRVDNLNEIVEMYNYNEDNMRIINTSQEVVLINDRVKINTTLDNFDNGEKSMLFIKLIDKLKNYS